MEYKEVFKSAVIGYESSDDDLSEIIPNSPDCLLQTKPITVPESPESPSLCDGNVDIVCGEHYEKTEVQLLNIYTDEGISIKQHKVSNNIPFLNLPLSSHAPKPLFQNDGCIAKCQSIAIRDPRSLLQNEQHKSDASAYSPLTHRPLLQTEQRSIEAPAYSPLTPRPLLLNEQRSIEAPAYSPLTLRPLLQTEQRSIEAPAYSPLTPRPLLLNEQRSIEAPAYSPLTLRPLLQTEQRSIEAPAYSPLTPRPLLLNEQRSIEAPAYSPLTLRPLLQTEQRSIEAPAYSPLTLRPLLLNEQRSIEAPAYSPLTPRPLKSKHNHNASLTSEVFEVPAQLCSCIDRCVSPVPPMSPETKKLLQMLEDNVFDSDDSVKDPNYEVDEDETDCSDLEERQTSFRRITVEAEINQVINKSPKKKPIKQNRRLNDDLDRIEREISTENEPLAERENCAEKGFDAVREINELENEEVNELENEDMDLRQGRPKKGRKRKGIFSRNEIKQRKYKNIKYTDRKHNLIEPKEFKSNGCSCKRNCSTLIPTEEQRKEFNTFMQLGSYIAQLIYITSSVEELQKKRSYQPDPSKKSKPKEFTRVYKLGGKIVCREMYLNTLQITTQKVNCALKKMRKGSLLDQRGVTGGWNRLPSEEYKFADEVINKLPKYKSHYRRENTDSVFLQPGMTVRKMYDEYYIKEFDNLPNKDTRRCLKYGTFKEYFYKNFNLKCKPLKKDTCNKCDYYAIAQKNGIKVREEHHEHLKKAERQRNQMKLDFERAQNEANIECLTFDLEKTLPLPRIPTNVVFYKRQLWVYNSGIHRASDDKGFCYVWVEGEAGRGAQEVASCLLQFIKNELGPNTEHLILWSDSCGGQNRNIKTTLMLKAALNSSDKLKTISMRFLEPGHTFLPNDTDFSKIESKIKEYDRIYTTEDYINIMKHCKNRKRLIVNRMKNEQFLGCSVIEQGIINRKVFKDKKKVNWLKTKEILLKKDYQYSIFMRADMDSQFDELFIQKKLVRGREEIQIVTTELVPLWPNGKKIAQAKLYDIKSLLHLIPADCRYFYENLRGSIEVVDDVDAFGTLYN